MHRFFIFPPDRIEGSGVVIISDELIHQIRNVLRFSITEKMILCDNTGYEYEVEVSEISKKEIVGKVLEKRLNTVEPRIRISLYVGLLKNRERFEFVLQKGTEVGISEFYPLITERTEKLSLNKFDRLRKIIKEAAEQSGRGVMPILHEPVVFREVINAPVHEGTMNLLATPDSDMIFRDVVNKMTNVNGVNLFVGPEGGFTDKEFNEVKNREVLTLKIGKQILRTETASIVIPAVLLSILGG